MSDDNTPNQGAGGGMPATGPTAAKTIEKALKPEKEIKENLKTEIKDIKEKNEKFEKSEIKEHKDAKHEKQEKNEIKEHKDAKHEKLEKNEAKEHKDAKHEKQEKNEIKEHKDAKHEKIEHKEFTKEISKIEIGEKPLAKEKDGKELKEGGFEGPGGPGDPGPIERRGVQGAGQQHFIGASERPDLSQGALKDEPDVGGQPGSSGTNTERPSTGGRGGRRT